MGEVAAKGESALWTPANFVTCARMVLVLAWLAVAETARAGGGMAVAWGAIILYAVIALTDKLDGWLARSRGEVTTFGKFLDPIADKLAVIVALLFLLESGVVPSWAVSVVIARELLVDGLRMVTSSKGVVIPAGRLGKWKTAVTMVAIVGLLVEALQPGIAAHPSTTPLPFDGSGWAGAILASLIFAGQLGLWLALALTVWSGVDYFVRAWPIMRDDDAGSDARGAAGAPEATLAGGSQ